jgi:hypothetical protein
MRLALIILLQVLVWQCFAQSKLKDLRITIEVKDVSFETLVSKLRNDYQINLVFGIDRIQPANRPISIKVSDFPLNDLMVIVSNHYNLKFEFLNNYVLLSPAEVKSKQADTHKIATPVNQVEEKVVLVDSSKNNSTPDIIVSSVLKDTKKDSIVFIEVVEKPKKEAVKVADGSTPFIAKKRRSHHFMAALFSVDYHRYHFNHLADPNQEYTSPTTYGYAFLYSISLNKKIRVGIGTMYSYKEFSYNRNFKILITDDPVSIPNTTTLTLKYVEVPVEVNYQLVKSNSAAISLVSGFNSAILTSKNETTVYLTQGDPKTKYFIESSNSFLFGALVGIRFSKKIYKNISLFCEPRYIKYFNAVNSSMMNSGADLFRLNTGLAFQIGDTP